MFRIFQSFFYLALKISIFVVASTTKFAYRAIVEREGRARVLYIIDGDTLRVRTQRRERSVRLLGIDAPESKINERAYEQAARKGLSPEEIVRRGVLAREKMRALVSKGDVVALEFESTREDKHGRLLAYVKSGNLNLNIYMVANGYAEPYFLGKNTKYKKEILEAYEKFREKNPPRRREERMPRKERASYKTSPENARTMEPEVYVAEIQR